MATSVANTWARAGLELRRGLPIAGQAPESIAAILRPGVDHEPTREALVTPEIRLTYQELDSAVDRAANVLESIGVKRGDRVAGCLPNGHEIVISFLACMRIGAIWVGIGRSHSLDERTYMLRNSEAVLLIADSVSATGLDLCSLPDLQRVMIGDAGQQGEWGQLNAEADSAQRARDVDPFEPCCIAYTSGTTGFPKGVVHSQHNLAVACLGQTAVGHLKPYTRQGMSLPLTLVTIMICGPLASFACRGTCAVRATNDPPGLARWVHHEQLTRVTLAPSTIYDLVTSREVVVADLAGLELPWTGGGPLDEELRKSFADKFGTMPLTSYGMTEVPAGIATELSGDNPQPGSVGHVYPTLTVIVADDSGQPVPPGEAGEVCVVSAQQGQYAGVYTPMLGYWKDPEATRELLRGNVLHTGDLGFMNGDGMLFLIGRLKDVVIRGASNVYPSEVERVLSSHPQVAECAVFGIPDARLGQALVAAVQLEPDASVTVEELLELCRDRLARYKVPDIVFLVVAMPRNAMGKVVKRELANLVPAPDGTH